MSLKVWFPLNGDLKNYGASNTTLVADNGPTVNANGKIGSCYSFSSNYISYAGDAITSFTECSICVWIKSTTASSYAQICALGVPGTNWKNTKFGIFQTSNGNITIVSSSGSNYTAQALRAKSNDTWQHICFTYSSGTLKVYVDGTLSETLTITVPDFSSVTNIFVGGNSLASSGAGFRLSGGYLNDVRIYDECLLANEVKEISKALVLHYPLNQPNRNKNLISSFTSGGRTTVSGKTVTIQSQETTGDTYFQINLNEALVANTTYTLSCKIKGASCSADWNFPLFAQNNPLSKILVVYHDKSFTSITFSLPTGSTYIGGTSIFMDDNGRPSTNPTPITLYDFKLEKSPIATPWCPPISDLSSRIDLIEYDCSGYNHNGTVTDSTSPTLADDSSRNSLCYQFNGTNQAVQIPFNNAIPTGGDGIFTMNVWTYHDSTWSSKSWETIFGGPSGFELEMKNGSTNSPVLYAYSWNKGSATYELNKWNMITMVRTTSDTKFFINGELKFTGTAGTLPTGNYFIGSWRDTSSQNYKGKVSDFKIYATALSADDITKEYHRFAAIYSDHSLATSEAQEYIGINLIQKANNGIATKTYTGALSSFAQSNCQISLTDNGYRIYRPANKNPTADGNTMWGGLVIKPYNENNQDVLFKGHTYILKWHVKGQSSNSGTDSGWSNQVGWGGGGLMPSPSNTSANWTPSNFTGEMDCWYKWTISDDVYKVCTSSYSSFVKGQTYLSYRDFKFGFGYTDTGSLGTDLYITNIRLYDITNNNQKVKIGVNGVINGNIVEGNFDNVSMLPDGEFYTTQFIERI